MRIPLIYIKDKQVFSKKEGILRFIGKPVDVAKKIKEQGYKLIHIVDEDALAGTPTNLDVYDSLTYFINVQVECAPDDKLVKQLLTLRCRVVLPPGELDVSGIKEKQLLVAKVPKNCEMPVDDFHDVVLEDAGEIKKFSSMGKRVMVYEKTKEKVWGVIFFF